MENSKAQVVNIEPTSPGEPKQKVKRIRTEEQIAADKERMARLRAMRGKNKIPEVVAPI